MHKDPACSGPFQIQWMCKSNEFIFSAIWPDAMIIQQKTAL